MAESEVVFRTRSDIEATIVQGLLESRGLHVQRVSGPPAGVFAFAVSPLGHIQVAVPTSEAAEARQLILSYGDAGGIAGEVTAPRRQFDAIEARLQYEFRDQGLLEHALTHKSKTAEDASGGVVDNESLEFLGDAVLGLVVAEALFRSFPRYSEGQKSKIKANLVSTASLAEMAEHLGLGEHMILGRGEEKTGGRRKQALLADTCEALIAAIYLDGGLDPARAFLMREFASGIEDARQPEYFGRDHKSRLQERLQAQGKPLPSYRIAGEVGPDHRKLFQVDVFVGDEMIAQGAGRTKKEAEQEGAKLALAAMEARHV